MQVEREVLIKLLGAFADAMEVVHRELALYQMLFTAACKAKGLTDEETKQAADRGRIAVAEKIDEACTKDYRTLLDKLPQIVDLLDSDQDAALRYLKEWNPKGTPH